MQPDNQATRYPNNQATDEQGEEIGYKQQFSQGEGGSPGLITTPGGNAPMTRNAPRQG